MPLSARVAATANSSRLNRKGKRRERYEDDPEEEATLLGEEHRDDGFNDAPETETVSVVRSQVELCSVQTYSHTYVEEIVIVKEEQDILE